MRHAFLRLCLAIAAGGLAWPAAGLAQSASKPAGVQVDLELVLAVDVSRSMDYQEQRIQRGGYVAAFRDPEVIGGILDGGVGKIAVTYIEWSGPASQQIRVPWTIIDSAASANAFADTLDQQSIERWNGTSISGGIDFADQLFGKGGVTGIRRVIDVSGDGPNNMGLPVAGERDKLVAKGVTINGLPLVLDGRYDSYMNANLGDYYRACVVGGTSSFVIEVNAINQFPAAVRRKLILEIADRGATLPPVMKAADKPPVDCLMGEKQRGFIP